MARIRIKICGIRDVETARAAVDAGADLIGMVFVEASPRLVSVETARRIVQSLPAHVEPVALFVDHPVDMIRATCDAIGVKTVQLHGRESPAVVAQLCPLRVMKALSAESDDWVSAAKPWNGVVSELAAVLCDAAPPPDAAKGFRGGHGQAFDWNALAAAKKAGAFAGFPPLFMAGGLHADNVAGAIEAVRPDGVDVSSGVEASRGVKDPAMIRAFCAAVRNRE
ncbi:MAG: phosphoribosylanthranilate isomerase [Planctomycetes bacterium]|nr:phosphoribosylanthranilate isomerase [Planctomycetota bacterium]